MGQGCSRLMQKYRWAIRGFRKTIIAPPVLCGRSLSYGLSYIHLGDWLYFGKCVPHVARILIVSSKPWIMVTVAVPCHKRRCTAGGSIKPESTAIALSAKARIKVRTSIETVNFALWSSSLIRCRLVGFCLATEFHTIWHRGHTLLRSNTILSFQRLSPSLYQTHDPWKKFERKWILPLYSRMRIVFSSNCHRFYHLI